MVPDPGALLQEGDGSWQPFPPPAGTCSCAGATAQFVLRDDGTGMAPAPRAATQPDPAHGRAKEGSGQCTVPCPRWLWDAARGSACRCCSSSLAAGRAPRRGGHLLMLFSLPAAPRAGGVASIFPRVQGGQRLFPTVPIGLHLPQIASTRLALRLAHPLAGMFPSCLHLFTHLPRILGGPLRVCPPGDPRLEHLRCGCPLDEHQSWGVPAAT